MPTAVSPTSLPNHLSLLNTQPLFAPHDSPIVYLQPLAKYLSWAFPSSSFCMS